MNIPSTLMWSWHKLFLSTGLHVWLLWLSLVATWQYNTIKGPRHAKMSLRECTKMHRFIRRMRSIIRAFALHLNILYCPNNLINGRRRPRLDCADMQSDLSLRCPHMPEDTFSYGAAKLIAWNIRYGGENWFKQMLFTVISPTQQTQKYLIQFNWPRAIWKRDLYFDKYNKQKKSRNFFLRAIFLNELFYQYFQNEIHLCGFYRWVNVSESLNPRHALTCFDRNSHI